VVRRAPAEGRHRLAAALVACALGLLAVAALSGCGGSSAADADVGDRKVRVTTTTNFITDTVRQIGGERVEVTGLMGPGVDPHLYKASADDVGTLRDADVIVYGGLQLEGKMTDLLDKLAERQTTVAITKDMPRDRLLEPARGAPEEYDPHVWFDVALWKTAARTAAAALKAKDPGHAAVYDRNLARYLAELDETDRYVARRIREIPERQRVLVTSHDAFAYFGRRYGLEVTAIQGISTAAEATTADIQRVAEALADARVRAVFVESSVPRQTIDAVLAAARREGQQARVGGELYSDAAGAEGSPEGTYAGMVRANADTIVEGLK
jgi:manganese/zinc/iron transport system substrate-binding protein